MASVKPEKNKDIDEISSRLCFKKFGGYSKSIITNFHYSEAKSHNLVLFDSLTTIEWYKYFASSTSI